MGVNNGNSNSNNSICGGTKQNKKNSVTFCEQLGIDSNGGTNSKELQRYLSVPTSDEETDPILTKSNSIAAMPIKSPNNGSSSLLDQIPEDGQPTMKASSTNRTNGTVPRSASFVMQDILSTHRPSTVMSALRRGSLAWLPGRSKNHISHGPDVESHMGSKASLSQIPHGNGAHCDLAIESRRKNRRVGDDALSTALSALYAKVIVILGIALPVTEILSSQIPANVYQGFYLYLYITSILFVIFVYASNMRRRAVMTLIKNYHEKTNIYPPKKRIQRFGSFYLRVGAIAFGIGAMVYSGLELGQYFELHASPGCSSVFIALTPATRMILSIVQMQFIFLNTSELDMARHKVFARFGLMHMVATNLCEWLYVLVEETKHEIHHLAHMVDGERTAYKIINLTTTTSIPTTIDDSSEEDMSAALMIAPGFNHTRERYINDGTPEYVDCQRTNIMGTLVQNASPFLFPCTIEYSLICAVILYEMWKKVKTIAEIDRTRRSSSKMAAGTKSAHHFSVDCSRAHRGMFGGIIVTVLTIICLIMYFVLHDEPGYEFFALQEVTIAETVLYSVTAAGVVAAIIKMRDLKYCRKHNDPHGSSVSLDCTLLVLAQTGVYVYGMFSIIGSYFSMKQGHSGAGEGMIAEIFSLVQTSMQTLFILNAVWRKCRGALQNRTKPGREIVTFLLVANMAMWFINTLIKGRASFRPSHLAFFGTWAWTVITHVSMPLAIFYRFHSTICLFEVWKSTYKVKHGDHH
ncbi:proton channel OtopLc isoform X2 [Toxorhynchites rutilus septentrionalis]|uniref:proton channel OtopLc isoform X2 n=1 Tax=Toxorhynchites rutilus septentrionalis TaxID=329112 RepID=UPI00247ABCEF|nr:proton channel OtopLc isoform X2 [Toxorhynchites rutilus septentrionalis]